MMMTASVIFYYCVLPKDKSVEPDKDIIITSENPCELLFLQKISYNSVKTTKMEVKQKTKRITLALLAVLTYNVA